MKKSLPLLVAICLFASVPLALAAEEAHVGPPKILTIIREDVKVGKVAAHEKVEMGYVRAFAKANWPAHYLGMTTMTGPSEAWFLVGYDSFAAIEKEDQEFQKSAALKAELEKLDTQDAEMISGVRRVLAVLDPELSHMTPGGPSGHRYFEVITYRVRPGHEADFIEAAKTIRAAYDEAHVDVSWAIFAVVAGMPSPTFLVMVPMKSLDELDAAFARRKTIMGAVGEEGMKKLRHMAAEGYAFVETSIFAVNPRISYPAKEMIASDPEFWAPKPMMKAAPAGEKKIPEKPVKK